MAKVIDGKKIAENMLNELKKEITELKINGINLTLAVIYVGDDLASKIYINNKRKACDYVGIKMKEFKFDCNANENDILKLINKLNVDKNVTGIMVQMPLPHQINAKKIVGAINPQKDVDGFSEVNLGKIISKNYDFLPCTPAGIMEILKSENVEIKGKRCVVVGRSNIVGKPLSLMLLNNDATVTICHSKTENLKEACKNADILISAVGEKNLITADMVKKDAVVIDVGINRNEFGKICGDVDFENVKKVASYITPVPGGVGPVTVAMLMKNVVLSARNLLKI